MDYISIAIVKSVTRLECRGKELWPQTPAIPSSQEISIKIA